MGWRAGLAGSLAGWGVADGDGDADDWGETALDVALEGGEEGGDWGCCGRQSLFALALSQSRVLSVVREGKTQSNASVRASVPLPLCASDGLYVKYVTFYTPSY